MYPACVLAGGRAGGGRLELWNGAVTVLPEQNRQFDVP